jgi:hypothetical protein
MCSRVQRKEVRAKISVALPSNRHRHQPPLLRDLHLHPFRLLFCISIATIYAFDPTLETDCAILAIIMSEKTQEKQAESSTPETSTSKPTTSTGAESPRTAKELDFDDDGHEALPVPDRLPTPKGTKRVSFQDEEGPTPPPKPPRPMSPQAQAEATLIEAFPSIDAKVVKAVLVASGGKVEPAFNALLSMSDPTFTQDVAPPPPPRRAATMSQVESDALYARQLSEHYNSAYTGFGSRERGDPPLPTGRKETGLKPNELYEEKEHSFFDGE